MCPAIECINDVGAVYTPRKEQDLKRAAYQPRRNGSSSSLYSTHFFQTGSAETNQSIILLEVAFCIIRNSIMYLLIDLWVSNKIKCVLSQVVVEHVTWNLCICQQNCNLHRARM